MSLDRFDKRILKILQTDADISIADLADRLDARHRALPRSDVDRMWTGGGQEPIELGG